MQASIGAYVRRLFSSGFYTAPGTQPSRLTSNQRIDLCPSWAPDGASLVFERWHHNDADIFSMTLEDQVTRLTDMPDQSEEYPEYSPDGTKISYELCRGTACALSVMNPDGSDQHVLVSRDTGGVEPVWSPDSTKLATTALFEKRHQYDIFIVTVVDGSIARLTQTRRREEVPHSWQALP